MRQFAAQFIRELLSFAMRHGLILSLGLFCLTLAFRASSVVAQPSWVQLGPDDRDSRILGIAIPPGWPESRTIVAFRGPRGAAGPPPAIVRTQDGAVTWQEFPLWPAEPDNRDQRVSVNFFDFAPGISLSESPPLFALLSGRGLYRSLDIGASWHQVWVMPEDDAPQQLALSPAFASDRLALILTRKGDIYRSVDAGATWHHQGDVLGRTTLGLTFLPGGTLFASLEASDDDDGRLGMAVSTDGGATFTPSQVALAPDEGSPLRTVRGMVPSPTYLTDQTVFAIAERPTTGSFCLNRSPVNPWLLRSVDGGAHWDAVHTPGSACGSAIRLGLSPTFASDGTGFYLRGTGGGSPASSRCLMYRTRDYGASWRNTGFDSGPYTACGDLHIAGGGTSLALYFRANYWFYSTDLGATRPLLPSPVPGSAISLMVGPRGPHDQMFAATTGGIWVTAPGHP